MPELPGRKPATTNEEKTQIRERYAADDPTNEIMEDYGISESTLRRIVQGVKKGEKVEKKTKVRPLDHVNCIECQTRFARYGDEQNKVFCSSTCFAAYIRHDFPSIGKQAQYPFECREVQELIRKKHAHFYSEAVFDRIEDDSADFLKW